MNSLYLVLDMQNDLVNEKGPNGSSPLGEQVRARNVVARTAVAIRRARDAGLHVGFVRVGFSADYHECPKYSPVFSAAKSAGIFQLGQWGTQIHPDLDVRPNDLQIVKHRVSPFYSTSLEVQLRALRIERIYCSGVSTQAVVQATVREGHDRDFEMIVLEDACAAHALVEHENSIGSLGRFAQFDSTERVQFA